MLTKSFEITAPLPPRGSATVLRQQLVDHILKSRPAVGERFFSDHELSRLSKVSRPTVRRALNDLEREGWIERRPGIGTFIGPRAGMGVSLRSGDGISVARRTVRLALMIHMLGDLGHDWYAGGVISGIDQAAEEMGVSLELLGDRDGDVKHISRRLLQSRPDVLAFCAPPLRHTVLMGEAHRVDIPCIGTGTLLASIGVPSVCEDGADAARRAVRHFVEHGHRHIGLVMGPFALPWVFQRRAGFMQGLIDAGLEPDDGMILWLTATDEAGRVDQIRQYLASRKPTALLFGSWVLIPPLDGMVRRGELRIPQDVSVITFDQQPAVANWLGVRPTHLRMPLAAMGRRLAEMARDLANGRTIEPVTTLPCDLVPGESVAAPA